MAQASPAWRGRLRDAQDFDLETVVAIYNSAIETRIATADLDPVTVDDRHEWFTRHTADRPLWVLEGDDGVRGWLSFDSFYGRPAYHAAAEVSLYVAPQHRGHGVGEELLGAAIERAPSLGLHTLIGLIFSQNVGGLRLFDKLGFLRWGVLPRIALIDEVERHLVIVGRRAEL